MRLWSFKLCGRILLNFRNSKLLTAWNLKSYQFLCKEVKVLWLKRSFLFQGSIEVLKSNLTRAIPILEKAGVVGLIEPINPYWVPHYFLNDFDVAQDIITEINHPNIRLMLDIFHLQYQKGNLSNNIKKYLPITGHVQIAQVPDRFILIQNWKSCPKSDVTIYSCLHNYLYSWVRWVVEFLSWVSKLAWFYQKSEWTFIELTARGVYKNWA